MRLSFMHLLIWQALSNVLNYILKLSLIGINYDHLAALAEARHLQKQIEIERTKVRINAKGGKAEMSAQEGSVFV